jgi:hypothetical protein
MPFHLSVANAVLIQGQLNRGLEPGFVAIAESDELERLETPGDRTQHFRRAQH